MPGRSFAATHTMLAYATPSLRFCPCAGDVPAWQPEKAQLLERIGWMSTSKQTPPVPPPVAGPHGDTCVTCFPCSSRPVPAPAQARPTTASDAAHHLTNEDLTGISWRRGFLYITGLGDTGDAVTPAARAAQCTPAPRRDSPASACRRAPPRSGGSTPARCRTPPAWWGSTARTGWPSRGSQAPRPPRAPRPRGLNDPTPP